MDIMRGMKKALVVPVYGIYYVLFELILGVGMKDPWDKICKWTEK